MLTYLAAFIFYTLAMIGILLIGFVIYKKTMLNTNADNKGMIKVLDSLNIAPKKMLLVIKIKNEKFLIASGAEHTTFLAKLEEDTIQKTKISSNYSKELEREQLQEAKLNRIQQQFRELYGSNSKEETAQQQRQEEPIQEEPMDFREQTPQKPDRKEMIRKLLKDLNETQTGIESRF